MLGIDSGLDMDVVFKSNAFVHTNRHWKHSGRCLLGNNKNGHCGYASVMQLYVIEKGCPPRSAEDAFKNGCPKLAKLIDAARELTIKVFLASGDTKILGGPQFATTERKTTLIALDYNMSINNPVDAVKVMGYVDRAGGGGGGHADGRALRHFANGLGMEKLEPVREVLVEDEALLMGVDGLSTPLAGVSMVMWQPGHWSAIASNVSPSCKYVDDRFFVPDLDSAPGFFDSEIVTPTLTPPPSFTPKLTPTLTPPPGFTHTPQFHP